MENRCCIVLSFFSLLDAVPSLHGSKEKPDILVWSWRMSTLRRSHARVSDVSQARRKKNSTFLTATPRENVLINSLKTTVLQQEFPFQG